MLNFRAFFHKHTKAELRQSCYVLPGIGASQIPMYVLQSFCTIDSIYRLRLSTRALCYVWCCTVLWYKTSFCLTIQFKHESQQGNETGKQGEDKQDNNKPKPISVSFVPVQPTVYKAADITAEVKLQVEFKGV